MQARQPTYLESLLNRLVEPAGKYLRAHPDANALAAVTALILREDDGSLPPVDEILENDQMLKAGRAYLALLLDNDRLPRGEQLSLEELTLPRGLLLQFFQGHADIQARAQEVLGLVERKFSQRSFQQATILLQLFETDHTTKLQNERKLFYEDMIQRLGIRRRYPLSKVEVQQVRDHFGKIATSLADVAPTDDESERTVADVAMPVTPWAGAAAHEDEDPVSGDEPEVAEKDQASSTLEMDNETIEKALSQDPPDIDGDAITALVRSFDWLAARHQISFCVLTRHPDEYVRWRRIVRGRDAAEKEEFMRFVPPRRWRSPADAVDLPLFELVAAYITPDAYKAYVETLTKACYFLLLAVGDTGLEAYLDTYFDWLGSMLEIDGTTFVDRLHRESTFGEQTLSETLGKIHDEHFVEALTKVTGDFTEARLREALLGFVGQMAETNFAEVAPGHYNLGGMVLDQLFGLEYPTKEFPFKIHRIV